MDITLKPDESLTWILYDISSDKGRRHVVKACKEAGLYRVQKSVFLGTVKHNRLDELSMRIEDHIDPETDRVYIFPMCAMDFRKVILQGQAFDGNLVTDNVRSLFL